MKRHLITASAVFIGLLGLTLAHAQEAQVIASDQAAQQKDVATDRSQEPHVLLKSYTLKYIKPEEFLRAAKFYYLESTSYGNTITARIASTQVSDLEKLLSVLDVEPKTVRFRVYPILAFRKLEPKIASSVIDPELRRVLDEMNSLWKFESYVVEGPSFISVKEGTGLDSFKLLSSHMMNLLISDVKVSGGEAGARSISIGQLRLSGQTITLNHIIDTVFFDTHETILKEKGFLVAGVSGYTGSDDAVILVLSAEIK